MDKYTYQFIKMNGYETNFDVINKWANSKGDGNYTVTIVKNDGKIESLIKEDE